MHPDLNSGIDALEEKKKNLAEEAWETGDWARYDEIAQKVLEIKEKNFVDAES